MLGNQRTYAYSTFVISLRHRINEHYLLLNVGQMECRDIRSSRVAELAIHLIGEQEQVVFLDQIPYLKHLFHRIEIAGGVVGIAYKYALGLGELSAPQTFQQGGNANPSSMLDGTVTIFAPAEIANAM